MARSMSSPPEAASVAPAAAAVSILSGFELELAAGLEDDGPEDPPPPTTDVTNE